MFGWNGKISRADPSNGKATFQDVNDDFALHFLGGKRSATKTRLHNIKHSSDSISHENLFIVIDRHSSPVPSCWLNHCYRVKSENEPLK